MTRSSWTTPYVVVALTVLAAGCSDGTQQLDVAGPAFARPGGGGGGGKVLYDVGVSGDMTLNDAVKAQRKSSDPFGNPDLTIENARVKISGPSGDLPTCRQNFPNLDFANAEEGWFGNEGEWTGQLTVKGGTHTVNFIGSRTLADGTTEQFQSTIGANAEPEQEADGAWSLTLLSAAQFSDARSTRHDGKHRCVNVTLRLSPA